MPEPTDTHYRIVAKAIAEGRLVPLLGSGVNLCGRPGGTGWRIMPWADSAAVVSSGAQASGTSP